MDALSPSEEKLRALFKKHYWGRTFERYWALRVLPPVIKQTLKYGSKAREPAGMSSWALLNDCWARCVQDGCWPSGYYKFQLYRPDRRAVAHHFIHEGVGLPVMKYINDPEDVAILDDKLQFASACERLGLPHVETVCYFKGGKLIQAQFQSADELPREDLFIKSTNLLCGRGIQRWRYNHESRSYEHDHLSLNAAELISHVRTMTKVGPPVAFWKRIRSRIPKLGFEHEREAQQARPYIIQRELKNHPDMARFTNGALCTIRVVTARALGGEPEIIVAALRMPTGQSRVDNFAAGGLASPVDLDTGRVGTAVYKDPRKPEVDEHPDSGENIAGETIPMWSDVRALCLQVHGAFPKVATVGWDVALTTDGPKLIEANPGWCVEVVQMAHGKPLGQTAWPELLMSHSG